MRVVEIKKLQKTNAHIGEEARNGASVQECDARPNVLIRHRWATKAPSGIAAGIIKNYF